MFGVNNTSFDLNRTKRYCSPLLLLFPLHARLKNIAMANALLHRRLNARQRG